MGCATGLVRFIVFAFNIICAIVGIVIIAVASVAISGIKKYNTGDLQLNEYLVAPGLILAVGIFIFIVSFFGCCGALRNSSCMLTTYAVILLVMFIIQLSLGIYAYVNLNGSDKQMQTEFQEAFKKTIAQYDKDNNVKEVVDLIQEELKCCGSTSSADYFPKPAPDSCKGHELIGCSQKLLDVIEDSLKLIAYVAMGICATELVGSIFAFCLASHSRR